MEQSLFLGRIENPIQLQSCLGKYQKICQKDYLERISNNISEDMSEKISEICQISFGGIPNSSSIDIFMPFAIFDYMGAFLRSGFANCYPRDQSNRMAAPVKVARQQTTPQNFPEPSEPCVWNLHQHTPEPSGTFRNPPTYTSTHRNSPEPSFQDLPEPTFRNLRQHTPEPSEIFRNLPELAPGTDTILYSGTLCNLPEPASGSYTSTSRNSSEPSGIFQDLPEPTFQNLRQHTPEPSEIFRNLPELASGTDTIL